MKNISPKKNIILLGSEDEKLLKKYIEEYNELYQKILILSPNDFIQILSKRVKIVLKEKINGFSSSNITKVENFILEKIYANDYKHSLFAKRSILQRDQNEMVNHYFNGVIIPHCDRDRKDGYYVHSCGNRFQIFKYKNNTIFDNINKKNNEEKNDNNILLLYCEECDMIYKSNLIKFCCFSTGEDFYSKLIDNTNTENYHLATWKKYHCNIIINDVMKCQKCHENLYYLPIENHLFCKKCNHEFEPNLYTWKCIKCKKDFIAEVKIFNPLEYKNMKISIKEAILNKRRAKPDYLGCGCEINNDAKKLKFYHKSSCLGDLYMGELNKKKIVVCSKCESMGSYEGYVWTCPICSKRFKTEINYLNDNVEEKENKNNNISNNENIKNIITGKYMNYSNSNYNINVGNISSIYKSQIKFKNNNSNLYEIPKNNLINKCKSDNKNIGLLRRNNSAIKLIDNTRLDFLEQSNNSNIYKNNNNMVNIKRVNIPKSKNYSPNCSPYKIQSKLDQRYLYNNIQEINTNNKRANRLMSNLDLTDTKNFQNILNKFFNGEKVNEISYADYNYNNNIVNYNKQKDNVKADLFGTKNLNQPYYKIFENNVVGKKRAYSNCNSININIDDGMPYTKIIPKNNKIIGTNKILLIK